MYIPFLISGLKSEYIILYFLKFQGAFPSFYTNVAFASIKFLILEALTYKLYSNPF